MTPPGAEEPVGGADTGAPSIIPLDALAAGRVSRRQLLQAAAAAAVGAVAFTGCAAPEHDLQAQSRVRQAEDEVSAYQQFYATACTGCGAGCGILVRLVDGSAKKVEGNPDHPVNQGRLCARGQALVQAEYHPDRLAFPMVRSGARPSGRLVQTSWDDAMARLADRLKSVSPGQLAVLAPRLPSFEAGLVARFAQAHGARLLVLETFGEEPLRRAAQRVYGSAGGLPFFDLANARFVLSFGADFLSTWISPVQYGVAYGQFRQGDYRAGSFKPRGSRPRGYLVQVEPRMSMTAANADEWLYVHPGTEGLLALSLAQVLTSSGRASADARAQALLGGAGGLGTYAPERVASQVGTTPTAIRDLADRLLANRPALVLGGGPTGAQTNGTDALTAILALNLLLGNTGQPGGVYPSSVSVSGAQGSQGLPSGVPLLDQPAPAPASLGDWRQLLDGATSGQVQAVLLLGANPVYELPGSLGVRAALERVPFIASLSSLPDESTALADLVLPSSLTLESWGATLADPSPGRPVLTVQQPVVQPVMNTRARGDVLLDLAHRLGGAVASALPWPSVEQALRTGLPSLGSVSGGSVPPAASPDAYWTTLLQRGGWWGPRAGAAPAPGAAPQSLDLGRVASPQLAGDPRQYPYVLLPFVHNTLGVGGGAFLPWLQATPDPMTTVVWRTWVEINPDLAQRLGVKEGDLLRVESPIGSLDVPVYVNPAAPPDVIGIPLGQGHSGYGRWADARGVNPLTILAPLADATSGALAYAATRVRLTRTGSTSILPKFEGTVPAYQLPGKEVLKIAVES